MKSFVIASFLAISATAFAAPAADAPAADCDGVKIATGPKGKGYSNLFADIKKVCGAKVNLCEVNTSGGLDNLTSLSTKEADLGFVQVDTWNTMKASDDNIAALQLVMPLNNNYLHVITSANGFSIQGEKKYGFLKGDAKQVVVNSFTDLRGQRVAAVGSAQLLARQLNKQLGYGMQVIDAKDDNAAFDMVKSGQVAAALTVSGWQGNKGPVGSLTQASGLTMVPFNAPVSEPFKVKPLNYKGIAVYNNNSLGVLNVLVTRPFSGQRSANVSALQSCLQSNLTELKEGPYQAGWNEVSSTASVPNMTQFKKK